MKSRILKSCGLLIALLTITACGNREVSYKADIAPILQQYCVECHSEKGQGYEKSGLLMSSYDSLMKGTRFGAIIKPGDSLTSTLVMLIEGRADPSIKMPHGRAALPKEKTDTVRKWVEQGAKNN
jgi:hypothetical protein